MTARRSLLLGWPLVLVLFAAAGLLLARDYRGIKHAADASLIGKTAPDARVADLRGYSRPLLHPSGHPVWLNFFATWCVPCKTEMPQIEDHYRRFGPHRLTLLGVDQQEPAQQVRRFAQTLGVTFPLVVDDGAAAGLYRVFALPTSIFIDERGVIRAVHIGAMSPQQMDADLATIAHVTSSQAGLH